MMTMIECPTADRLKAYSLGHLCESESDDLFQHLRSCDGCKSELETMDDGDDSLVHHLRTPDADASLENEADCKLAVAKALGALANHEHDRSSIDPEILPKTIGEYEVLQPIGRGGMGNVYLAQHTKLGRQVALKVLSSHRLADQRMRDRFDAEMRAVGRLSHPNIVTAHDAREVDNTAVLVTEYIDGFDLGQLVARTGPLSTENAAEIVCKVAAALQYTSEQGFVHRDVKPSNIMVSRDGQVKLLDLGLARLLLGDEDRVEITGTGQAIGTADYVAPEQVTDSRSVDVHADIYSLGCTLFKLLTGTAPFADDQHLTAFAKMTAHVSTPPPKLQDCMPNLPVAMSKLVDSMLAKEPSKRPASPGEIAATVAKFSSGSDLVALVQTALQSPPKPVAAMISSTTAKSMPWFKRPVPRGYLVATGFGGFLLGMLMMGLFIKITYKDGTVVKAPVDGAQIEIVDDGKAASKDQATTEAVDLGQQEQQTEKNKSSIAKLVAPQDDAPSELPNMIAFAICAEADADSNDPDGVWYPVAEHIQAPKMQMMNDLPKVLLRQNVGIMWDQIQNHILAVQSSGQGLEVRFDDSLAAEMKKLTSENLGKTLAIIVNRRVICAPKIQSVIGASVLLVGDFSKAEQEELRACLSLAHPPSAQVPVTLSKKVVEKFQGIWVTPRNPPYEPWFVHFEKGTFFSASANENRNLRVLDKGKYEIVERADELSFAIDASKAPVTFKLDDPDHATWVRIDNVTGSEVTVQRFTRVGGVLPKTPDEMAAFVKSLTASMHSEPNQEIVSAIGLLKGVYELGFEAAQERFRKAFESKKTLRAVQEALVKEYQSKKIRRTVPILKQFHNHYGVLERSPGSINQKPAKSGTKSNPPYSWRVALLPFINQVDLYQQYNFKEPWDSESNKKLLKKMPEIYRCFHKDAWNAEVGHTQLAGYAEVGITTRDETSATLLVVRTKESFPWTKPVDLTEMDAELLEPITRVMVDGSVVMDEKIDLELLQKIISIDGE